MGIRLSSIAAAIRLLEARVGMDQEAQMTPLYPYIEVELQGQDGNALSIIARVVQALRKEFISKEQIREFTDDAMSGDYNHLIQTVMKWVTCK